MGETTAITSLSRILYRDREIEIYENKRGH